MEQIKKLFDILAELVHNSFYGKIELNFENGKITSMKKTESIKL